jgi:hypothetical protein
MGVHVFVPQFKWFVADGQATVDAPLAKGVPAELAVFLLAVEQLTLDTSHPKTSFKKVASAVPLVPVMSITPPLLTKLARVARDVDESPETAFSMSVMKKKVAAESLDARSDRPKLVIVASTE